MARPRAIYASIPPNEQGIPVWDQTMGVVPVEYSRPYPYWPNLDWCGNTFDDDSPTEYNLEHPKYLWSHPIVQNPVYGENYIFIRKWFVGQPQGGFDFQTIPANDLIFVITIAADDQYTSALFINDFNTGEVQTPIGSNTNTLNNDGWRNVKTNLYHVDLTRTTLGTPINLVTEVINLPQIPHGIVDTNPAMFTWTMYIFNH